MGTEDQITQKGVIGNVCKYGSHAPKDATVLAPGCMMQGQAGAHRDHEHSRPKACDNNQTVAQDLP